MITAEHIKIPALILWHYHQYFYWRKLLLVSSGAHINIYRLHKRSEMWVAAHGSNNVRLKFDMESLFTGEFHQPLIAAFTRGGKLKAVCRHHDNRCGLTAGKPQTPQHQRLIEQLHFHVLTMFTRRRQRKTVQGIKMQPQRKRNSTNNRYDKYTRHLLARGVNTLKTESSFIIPILNTASGL